MRTYKHYIGSRVVFSFPYIVEIEVTTGSDKMSGPGKRQIQTIKNGIAFSVLCGDT